MGRERASIVRTRTGTTRDFIGPSIELNTVKSERGPPSAAIRSPNRAGTSTRSRFTANRCGTSPARESLSLGAHPRRHRAGQSRRRHISIDSGRLGSWVLALGSQLSGKLCTSPHRGTCVSQSQPRCHPERQRGIPRLGRTASNFRIPRSARDDKSVKSAPGSALRRERADSRQLRARMLRAKSSAASAATRLRRARR